MGDRRASTDEQRWPPARDAVEMQRWLDPAGADAPRIALIRHPAAPYSSTARLEEFKEVAAAAYAYLTIVRDLDLLPIPRRWLDALAPGEPGASFGWLPIEPPALKPLQHIASLPVFDIRESKDPPRVNSGLVLLAGELIAGQPLGSEIGLRVMVDAASGDTGGILIRGASIALPYGHYGREMTGDLVQSLLQEGFLAGFLAAERGRIATVAGLEPTTLSLRGIRIAQFESRADTLSAADGHKPLALDVRMRGLSPNQIDQPSDAYEVFLRLSPSPNEGKAPTVIVTNRVLLSACANERDHPLDPASHGGPALWRKRRPTRSEDELAGELEDDDVPAALQVAGHFDVVQTWFAHDSAPPLLKEVVPTLAPRLRSNDFSAISAYRNVQALFARFTLYGLPLIPYFQCADLPLTIKYRSGVRPGPGKDGQTVNGRVLPQPWPKTADFSLVNVAAQRPRLEMHLALADFRVRDRDIWSGAAPSYATPLGFADDPRWIWHEFAHVLLMARAGRTRIPLCAQHGRRPGRHRRRSPLAPLDRPALAGRNVPVCVRTAAARPLRRMRLGLVRPARSGDARGTGIQPAAP